MSGPAQTNWGSHHDKARVGPLLKKKLGPEYTATRSGAGGQKMNYIEGWKAIELANDVFGFDGWTTEVKTLEVDYIDEVQKDRAATYSVGVTALVRVTLQNGTAHEDVGYGRCTGMKDKGDAIEKCKKEAVTDALKRALKTFGSVLGGCLYDKTFLKDVSKMTVPRKPFDTGCLLRAEDLEQESHPCVASTSAQPYYPVQQQQQQNVQQNYVPMAATAPPPGHPTPRPRPQQVELSPQQQQQQQPKAEPVPKPQAPPPSKAAVPTPQRPHPPAAKPSPAANAVPRPRPWEQQQQQPAKTPLSRSVSVPAPPRASQGDEFSMLDGDFLDEIDDEAIQQSIDAKLAADQEHAQQETRRASSGEGAGGGNMSSVSMFGVAEDSGFVESTAVGGTGQMQRASMSPNKKGALASKDGNSNGPPVVKTAAQMLASNPNRVPVPKPGLRPAQPPARPNGVPIQAGSLPPGLNVGSPAGRAFHPQQQQQRPLSGGGGLQSAKRAYEEQQQRVGGSPEGLKRAKTVR